MKELIRSRELGIYYYVDDFDNAIRWAPGKFDVVSNYIVSIKDAHKHGDITSADVEELLSRFTCHKCDERKKCVYAYDSYNTDDDCLADK